MVWLRHKGCATPAVEYVGATPLHLGPVMRSADWKYADAVKYDANRPLLFTCPDCGKPACVRADQLETVDGSPYRYGDRPRPQAAPKKRTLLDRLRAVFSF